MLSIFVEFFAHSVYKHTYQFFIPVSISVCLILVYNLKKSTIKIAINTNNKKHSNLTCVFKKCKTPSMSCLKNVFTNICPIKFNPNTAKNPIGINQYVSIHHPSFFVELILHEIEFGSPPILFFPIAIIVNITGIPIDIIY